MARFNISRNAEGIGYLLDVQADLLDHLNTRVVVPLLPLDIAPIPARTLNPFFTIVGISVSMVTQFMAAVPIQILKSSLLSQDSKRDEITAAHTQTRPVTGLARQPCSYITKPNTLASSIPGSSARMNASPTRNAFT